MPVPRPQTGGDAREFAARSQRALGEANDRLMNDRAFYDDVRARFGGAPQ